MATTIYLHGPHDFLARRVDTTEFVTLLTGDASLLLYTAEDCDNLIAAAFTAKSLLAGDNQEVAS